MLVVNDKPLSEALSLLTRWYGLHISVQPDSLLQRRVTMRASLDSTRQAVAKHLDVLERAGLVHVRREGRYRLHTLDRAPLRAAWDEWFRPLVQPDDPIKE